MGWRLIFVFFWDIIEVIFCIMWYMLFLVVLNYSVFSVLILLFESLRVFLSILVFNVGFERVLIVFVVFVGVFCFVLCISW